MEYKLQKFNDRWHACFEQEKKLLADKLSRFKIANIEHVGATSAMLCDTLGTIDILVGIDDIVELETIKNHLSQNGYEFIEKGSSKASLFFVRREEKGIVCTVRIMVNGCLQYQRIYAFAMYLKGHENRALKYNDYRKTVLEKCGGNLAVYNKFKGNFVESILTEYCKFE